MTAAPLVLMLILGFQETSRPSEAVSPHFTVDVLDKGTDDAGARLLITRKGATRYHIVTLNRALGRFRRARLRDDEGRVIVIAERGFASVDPVGRAPQDEVYGYGATESENGHWVAYTRALRDAENTHAGDGILMYDTTKTPDQNRAAFPIAAERSSASGWPVYPPATQWKKSSGLEPPPPHSGSYQSWEGSLYVAVLRTSTADRLVIADVGQPDMRVCSKVLPQDSERWSKRSSVTSGRKDGNYVAEIRSHLGGTEPETITFPANCGSD